MGMREERENWAASAERHASRMYTKTKNPYYVVLGIAAARLAEWKVPDWALEVLLDSVENAYWENDKGADLSIDRALGLATKRGGTPVRRKGERESKETWSFEMIRTILYCFDISIPDACEAVYYSIDYEFAQGMEKSLSSDPNWPDRYTDDQLAKIGLTRIEAAEMIARERQRENEIINKKGYSPEVRKKLRAQGWWEITRGDTLGYSLEQLINRYYRAGTKDPIDYGKVDEKTYFFFRGSLLIDGPKCARRIAKHGEADPDFGYDSALRGVTPTAEFKRWLDRVRPNLTADSK